jgi:hypothetical protein
LGRISVIEDPRIERNSKSTNDDHVWIVPSVIRGNLPLTVREIADKMGISIGSFRECFTEKRQMRRFKAKLVQRLLTDDQKEKLVEISQELLANANGNEDFLKNVITGDETWVYGNDI